MLDDTKGGTMKVAYFLGAGATKEDNREVPMGDKLLHSLLQRPQAGERLREFLSRIFDVESVAAESDETTRPRLDDVFTLIDAPLYDRAPAPVGWTTDSLRAVRHELVAGIGAVIAEALGPLHAPIAREFVSLLPPDGTTVISTNYDIVIDNCLADAVNVHYGVAVRHSLTHVGVIPGPPTRRSEVRHFHRGAAMLEVQVGRIPLLKLHGSLNWLYCRRCDELDITVRDKGAIYVLSDPELGRCVAPDCTGRYEALLVGPSLEQRYEDRPLRDTWRLAEEALQNAEKLVIIGYSLPEADYLIRAMFARAFARRSDCVTVVNTGEGDPHLRLRYKRLFPNAQFEPEGFAKYVRDQSRVGHT